MGPLEDAVVERSVVRGPVIIGARARIVHAYVGPFTSIMNDVEIQDTEIEHSIVLEGSCLRDLANRHFQPRDPASRLSERHRRDHE